MTIWSNDEVEYDATAIEGARQALKIADEIYGSPTEDQKVVSLIRIFNPEPVPEWVEQLREAIRLHDEEGVPLDWAERFTGFLD